jgi:trehalose 6-phosphate phosphatase
MPADDTSPSHASAAQVLERCAPFLDRRPLLVVSDFDGTLSRIVLDPWGAQIVPAARRALRRLAAIPGVEVCLLSGRLARDVAARARVGGATYVGNHGMERGHLTRRGRAEGLGVQLVPVDPTLVTAAMKIASEVAAAIPEPWLVVERKPAAVAFHFRAAPDIEAASTRVRATAADADSAGRFVHHAGRRVLELRPIDAPGKGEALGSLVAELRPAATLVLGDDVTDAAAFRVLRAARQAGTLEGCAIAVQARAEVPAEVLEGADVVLGSPVDAARLLGGLVRRLAPRRNAFERDPEDAEA